MNLKEMQIAFKDFILDKSPVKFEVDNLDSLNIYKKNYYGNLHNVLNNKFKTSSKYIKENIKLYCKYIEFNPSIDGNLDNYGDDFPQFLALNNYDSAAELANLDLLLFKSQNSFKNKGLDPNLLANIQPCNFDKLYFILSKNLYLSTIYLKNYEIWRELNDNLEFHKEPHVILRADDLIYLEIDNQGSCPQVNQITKGEYEFLKQLIAGDNLLLATEKALNSDAKFNLNNFLKFCFKNCLITDYQYSKG
jgi:hypothetical protein